jgi:hypothetical protein
MMPAATSVKVFLVAVAALLLGGISFLPTVWALTFVVWVVRWGQERNLAPRLRLARLVPRMLGASTVCLVGIGTYVHIGIVERFASDLPTAPERNVVKAAIPLLCPLYQLGQVAETQVKGPRDAYRAYKQWRGASQRLHRAALALPEEDAATSNLRQDILQFAAFVAQVPEHKLIEAGVQAEIQRRAERAGQGLETWMDKTLAQWRDKYPGFSLLEKCPGSIQAFVLFDALGQPSVVDLVFEVGPGFLEALECVDGVDAAAVLSASPGQQETD